MGKTTQISWTDATWNVARGCRKVDGDCLWCYMYREAMPSKEKPKGSRYNAFEVTKTKTVFDLPLKLKLAKSECWDGRPLIFTSSLTDVFIEEIDAFRNEMWDIIRQRPNYIFQILTKRPERIIDHLPPDWGEGWDNVWLGTSVGSNGHKAKQRLVDLSKVPAKTRFVSFEPLWERIELSTIPKEVMSKYSWGIIGGESGNENGKYRYRPCELEWIESLITSLKEIGGIAVFVKQLGTYLSKQMGLADRHGADIGEFPEHLQLREFPQGSK